MATLFLFLVIVAYCGNHGINGQAVKVITQPHNVTGCVGGTAMFTCVMEFQNVNITTVDIRWWRIRIDDSYWPLPIYTEGNNRFSITNNISGEMLTSVLVITWLRSTYVGPYWLGMTNGTRLSDVVFLSIVPNAPVNIRFPPQNITNVSFVVQWDAVVDQSVNRYIVSVDWTDDWYHTRSVTVRETSYTVTGLTPNTTYTITVTSIDISNCTGVASVGEEVTTDVSVSMDITINDTYRSPAINPTVITVTTDNSVTINATIHSDTELIPTLDVTVTSNFIPTVIATNPVDTTGLGDRESDSSGSNSLSTGAAVAITFAVTFIISVTATAIITFIVAYVCVKRTFEKANVINTHNPIGVSPPEKALYEMVGPPTHTVTKDDLEMQKNPAYGLSHKVAMDTNPAYESYK